MTSFGSIAQVFRPYFLTILPGNGESKYPAIFQVEDYGFGWGIGATGLPGSEGFGPISNEREVDFTVEFENRSVKTTFVKLMAECTKIVLSYTAYFYCYRT